MWQDLRQLEADCLLAIERYAIANYEEQCKKYDAPFEGGASVENEGMCLFAKEFRKRFSKLLVRNGSIDIDSYDQIQVFLTKGKPTKLHAIDTLEDLGVSEHECLFVYEYKNEAKQLYLCIFTNPSDACGHFTDQKHKLEVTMSAGIEDEPETSKIFTYARAEKSASHRYARIIYRGTANDFVSEIAASRLNESAWPYMISLEITEICTALPYLLTAFIINQDKRVGFFRNNNQIEQLFSADPEREPRRKRAAKQIESLVRLFTFSDSFALTLPQSVDSDELTRYLFDYSKNDRCRPQAIITVFALCVQIFQEYFFEETFCKDISSLKSALGISAVDDEDTRAQVMNAIILTSARLLDLKTGCFKALPSFETIKGDDEYLKHICTTINHYLYNLA